MTRSVFELSGRTALVVGGRGFLGRHISAALAEAGSHVYSADLSEPSLAASHALPLASQPQIEQRMVDVTRPDSVKALIDALVEETERIDTLVYSVTAKPDDFYMPFVECSLGGWQKILKAELDGLFLVAQQVGRHMESQGSGSMIFVASIYGMVGNDQRIYEGSNLAEIYCNSSDEAPKRIYSHAGYAAAKGGVIALTRFLAAYWGGEGIRVNSVTVGGVAHPSENSEFVKRYSARVPLGRKADSQEISGAIVFLASKASSYITGHNLVVDGGWTAW